MAAASVEIVVPGAGLALNHVGLTVPDIRAAIDWYSEVFGFRCIMGPRVLRSSAAPTAETASIFGPEFRVAYQAHLLTADGAGLELFQFVDPQATDPATGLGWREPGPWHLCFTHPEVAVQVQRVVDHGGSQVCPVFRFVPGKPYELAYARDPWGTVLELMSDDYATVFGGWPQAGMLEATEWMPAGRLDGR